MSFAPIPGVALFAHWLLVLLFSLRVMRRRAPVGVSLAWLLIIFVAPFVGVLLYVLFGEKRLARRRLAQLARSTPAILEWQRRLGERFGAPPAESARTALIERLAEGAQGRPKLRGNNLALLTDADSVFDAMIRDIDSATTSCDAEFYIWDEGGRTADVADALVRAAARGVRCRALADALGSERFLRRPLARKLREAGVTLRSALPAGLRQALYSRTDLRNHRKALVVDGRIAYTGSQNLADPRFFEQNAGAGQWVDAMVRVTGPAVLPISGVFELDWALETAGALELDEGERVEAEAGSAAVQVVPSGPDSRPGTINQLFLSALYSAERKLTITTPYFIPDDALLGALEAAAARGVETTLIVPARNNSRMVRFASSAHYDGLLAAGVRIAHFNAGLLHTKSITVDDAFSIFGSANLDIRSLWLNLEISLFIYDQTFTSELSALQQRYLADSTLIRLEEWRRRPNWVRWAEDVFRLLSPLL
ncbi:MAG: cardiolipin synthase [Bryobacterales bacterium]|nr:cardiolipin synthase [Acidobacteriota bacterium]MCB9384993.1 cardiolipin synthase [Bryobacterales bacterium]